MSQFWRLEIYIWSLYRSEGRDFAAEKRGDAPHMLAWLKFYALYIYIT